MLLLPLSQVRNMMKMNALTDGRLGYNSLLALLIALEADYYVLTTASNWSRLINELRLNVVEPSQSLLLQQGGGTERGGGAQCEQQGQGQGHRLGHESRGSDRDRNSSRSASTAAFATFMLDLRQSRGRRGDD